MSHFAPRPFPAAEQHCHELIVKYLHAAYPQAPTAVPKQPEVRVEAHTVTSIEAHGMGRNAFQGEWLGAGKEHRAILVQTPGVWVAGCTSTGSADDAGNRLALMLPDAKGVQPRVAGGGGLPDTSWEYREAFHTARIHHADLLDFQFLQPEHVTVFHVRELDAHGHRLHDGQGIVVYFMKETSRQRRKRRLGEAEAEEEVRGEYRPPARGNPPVGMAVQALVKCFLEYVDADGVPAVDWDVRWRTPPPNSSNAPDTISVFGSGANIYNKCTVQRQETIFYGLPELQAFYGLAGPAIRVTWMEPGPNGGQKSELVDFRFAGKRVGHDNNLVEGTRWSVHPHGGASRLPRALRAVKFLEFTHRVEL